MTALLALHLVDSTAFALAAILLARLLHRAPAAARHTLLLAATLKFALPLRAVFACGEALGSLLPVRAIPAPPGLLLLTVQITATPSAAAQPPWHLVTLALWLSGAAFLLGRWGWGLNVAQTAHVPAPPTVLAALHRAGDRLGLQRPVALFLTGASPELFLTGILHPTIIVPEGLPARLTSSELEAVLLHELAHVRRLDNLALTLAHIVRCVFWFHPLLPWLERRIRAEAETACDELVLTSGITPAVYIQGICKTCRLALLRPMGGRSYFSNSDLKPRLEHLMSTPDPARKPAQRILSLLLLPTLFFGALLAGVSSNSSLQAQSSSGNMDAQDSSCAVSGVHLPQGTTTRQAGRLLVCGAVDGKARWVTTTEAARDQSKPVVEIDNPPPISCTPTAPVGNLCTCSQLRFSPGSVVGSPRGALVCPESGGTWLPYRGDGATPRDAADLSPFPVPAETASIFRVGNGVTAPVLTYSVEPEFTEAARKKKIAANPLVALVVGTDGSPLDVHILRSSAEGKTGRQRDAAATLDEQALRAVRQWRFQPGSRDGQPVPVELKVEVNFQIF